jgi:type II secretory pathway component PulC
VVESAAPLPNLVEETAEAIQNLALVGISWSSNPDAIVEDKSQQRTYFVKRGQMVGENVKVEAIFKDHVVVSFEDKEYELR